MKRCGILAVIVFYVAFLCEAPIGDTVEEKKLLEASGVFAGDDQGAGTSMCFKELPVPKSWHLGYNGSFLDYEYNFAESVPVFLWNNSLWLSSSESVSSVNLTFYPNETASFNFTIGKLFQNSNSSLRYCHGFGPSQPDGQPDGNCVIPWILFAIDLFYGGVVTVVLFLVCKLLRNKGTDKKKPEDESLKYPVPGTPHNVANHDDGEQRFDGASGLSTSDANVSEVASDEQNDRMAIDKVDISQRGMARQNTSRAPEVRVVMEPPNQSETVSPEPESCEPPKEIPGAGPTDDQ